MRTKISSALLAGVLLLGAGLGYSVISSPATAVAQEEGEDDHDRGPRRHVLGFLGDVLEELTDDGTITAGQAEAIIEATEAKAAALGQDRLRLRGLIRGLLADGTMTEDEAAQLPEDHWLLREAFDEARADGELTVEEIRETLPHPHRHPYRRTAPSPLGP